MPNYSKIIQIGNLTRDPELKYSQNGVVFTTFTLATNFKGGEKEETCFIDVVLFGKQAETAEKYLKKGLSVLVEGRLSQEQWTDKETGAKRSKHKIIGNQITFMGGKADTPKQREPGDEAGEDLPF